MKVQFSKNITIGTTFSNEEYDRSSITVSPITPIDVYTLCNLRREYAKHTLYLTTLRDAILQYQNAPQSKSSLNVNAKEFIPSFLEVSI
ncbi:hypothetical protein BC833DRAFT_607046 [Globomyces pollinis-pini]|nr:hypothetical protein BC833DRAFT_607046 [Globomyces pollinis-pini]KAJ2998699.1 hypothetical protein HDV02_004144 [Globomyces sp. JEL0801]